MEKKFLKYTVIIVIFFIGLSMGVSYQDNNRSQDLQDQLDEFEDDITLPNNDFEPVNPYDGDSTVSTGPSVNHNLFTSLAKDGEYIITKGLELILDKSDDVFRFIFGSK